MKMKIPLVVFWLYCCFYTGKAGENLAFRKPADQTGVYVYHGTRLTADKAVDGLANCTDVMCCAHPEAEPGEHARWWVDLNDTYMVQNVTIYSRKTGYNGRLDYFEISVGPSETNLSSCANHSGQVNEGETVTVMCNDIGQIVHFERTHGPEDDIKYVELCEVIITGYKYTDPVDETDTVNDKSYLMFGLLLAACIAILIIVITTSVVCLRKKHAKNKHDRNQLQIRKTSDTTEINGTSHNGTPSYVDLIQTPVASIHVSGTVHYSRAEYHYVINDKPRLIGQQIDVTPDGTYEIPRTYVNELQNVNSYECLKNK